ncbi:MAG TPA: type II CAAX endopeptidase family protein [Gaiellaceae bacterium]|nr:type II CAAX endopeptidase family protein [Gaiellaceae bacterium]
METRDTTQEVKQLGTRGRLVGWSSLVIGLIALQYASRLGGGKPPRDILYKYSTAASSAVVYGILLALVLWIAGSRTDLLMLRRPASWPRALGLAVLLLIGVFIAIALLDPILHGAREQGLTPKSWEPSHKWEYAANFVVIAIVAPIVEELTFRGLGFSLLERFGTWTAIVAIGITFALAHGLFEAFPELALFGCALAWLRWKTKSVYPGMLLHGTFNSISLIAAVTATHH